MSADKRSVATDALETLGTIIHDGCGRDAIHVAVEPVQAQEKLFPGQEVSRFGLSHPDIDRVGIVDPFLKEPVFPGQWFWLLLYPRTITSLRHVWSHPAFDDPAPEVAVSKPDKEASEAWLRDFIGQHTYADYDRVIKGAAEYEAHAKEDGNYFYVENNGDYLHISGNDASGEIPPEFWVHIEVVTGKKVPSDKRATYFSCSC